MQMSLETPLTSFDPSTCSNASEKGSPPNVRNTIDELSTTNVEKRKTILTIVPSLKFSFPPDRNDERNVHMKTTNMMNHTIVITPTSRGIRLAPNKYFFLSP